jgi:hypothetical protein
MAERVTLEQLQGGGLQAVDVYLSRFGGVVSLRELTGAQVLKATKLAASSLPGTEGRVTDVGKQRALMVAFALTEPSLGETDEEKALKVEVVQGLGYAPQLLLYSVLMMLTEEELTADHREALLREVAEPEHLLALNVSASPETILDGAGDDADEVLRVALRIPAVLSGSLSMGTVKRLAAALDAERDALAEKVAVRIAERLATLMSAGG